MGSDAAAGQGEKRAEEPGVTRSQEVAEGPGIAEEGSGRGLGKKENRNVARVGGIRTLEAREGVVRSYSKLCFSLRSKPVRPPGSLNLPLRGPPDAT